MNAAARQAAAWLVRLTADDPAERARAHLDYERWKQADPQHADSAAAMERLLGEVQALRPKRRPARAALAAALPRRGRRRAMAVVLALLLPLAALLQPSLVDDWLADLHSGTGEWTLHTLADGSTLTLGSDSAVELDFDEQRRVIVLRRGALLIDVAPDAARPLLVQTPQGVIRALGTRFAVTRTAESTRLDMLESRVAVRNATDAALEVSGGQQLTIYRDRLTTPAPLDVEGVTAAWREQRLVVSDEPLSAVLEQLGRHRPGALLFDRAALADLGVTAVLPLDDTDRALQLLARTFPALRIHRASRWLVMVDRAEE